MNWNQLNYVLTVARTKNITRAARMLYLSQPSLSLSLKSLENELSVSLFRREQGGLELTYAGTLFCQWAEAVLSSHQQLCAQLQDISSGQRQLIRLGISPHRSTILMPEIMERFYQKFPRCEVHITELPAPILRKQLEEGELDFILDAANPDTVTYQSELLYQENIVLAVPVSFLTEKIREQRSLPLSALGNLPFILLPEEQLIGSIGRKLCEAVNYHPTVRLVCGNIEQALSLAGRQLGVVFVPEIFAKEGRLSGQVRYFQIEETEGSRALCLVCRKNLYQPEPLRYLLGLFREWVPKLYEPQQQK